MVGSLYLEPKAISWDNLRIPRWSSGQDSVIPMWDQIQVQLLVRELRSHVWDQIQVWPLVRELRSHVLQLRVFMAKLRNLHVPTKTEDAVSYS